jgi:hypothetical protein
MLQQMGQKKPQWIAPNFFKIMGNMEPLNVPQSTTPINEKPTEKPTSSQCGP